MGAVFSILVVFVMASVMIFAGTQKASAETPTWAQVGTVAASAAGGAAIGAAVADGVGAIVGGIIGAGLGAYGVGWLGGGGSESTTQAEQTAYAKDLANETNNNLEWAHVDSANTGNLIGMDENYFAQKAEFAAYDLYENQTRTGAPYVYNPMYVLSQSEVTNGTLAWEWSVTQEYDAAMNPLGSASNYFVGDYSGMNEGLVWNSGLISDAPYQQYQLTNNIELGDGPGANNQYGYEVVPANGTETLVCTSVSGPQSCDFLVTDYAGHTLQDIRLTLPADGYYSFKLADFGYESGQYGFAVANISGSYDPMQNWELFGLCSEGFTSPNALNTPAIMAWNYNGTSAPIFGGAIWGGPTWTYAWIGPDPYGNSADSQEHAQSELQPCCYLECDYIWRILGQCPTGTGHEYGVQRIEHDKPDGGSEQLRPGLL